MRFTLESCFRISGEHIGRYRSLRLLARRVFKASRAFMIWCHGARGACTNSTLAKPFFLSGQATARMQWRI
jgi:hypothetical protein